MLKIIYLILGMIATPFLMEWVNTKTDQHAVIKNAIKGWPAYAVNVVVCLAVALIICVLPAGWSISVTSVLILWLAVYFGNQFFFNTIVKPLANYRN